MKVKLLVPRASAGFSQNVGDEVEVSSDEAVRMIEAGQAEAIRGAAKKSTATKKNETEKAVKA